MKPKSKHKGFSFSCRPQSYCLLISFLACFFSANAQVKSTTDKAPVVRNMDEYKKTPKAAKRKAALDKATPGPTTRDVRFQDGTVLHIKLDKKAPDVVMNGPVKKQVGPSKKESSGGYDCTVTTVNLTATSDNFLNNDYSGSTANIFPGACYTYASLTDGSWKQQEGTRNSVTITTDNPNTKVPYVTVQNPSMATLYAAVAKIFSGFKNTNGNESLTYQVSEAENSATYNLQIGAAASGFGADLSNVYSTGNQSNHVHLTIDATKTLFTLMTTPPDSGFFKDPKIEATPYLSFIGEVSYGVRVLANADLTFNSEQDADQFKGSYSGFGVSVSLNVNYGTSSKSTQTTINGYMIGGPGSQVVAYSLDDLKKQIEKAFAGATYQNARPIKYKAYSMGGDVLNTYSATDNFNERSCVPADGGSPEIDNVTLTFTQGNDGKEPASVYWVAMFPGVDTDTNPDHAMFIYNAAWPNSGNQGYSNNGKVTVILKPNQWKYDDKGKKMVGGYKGKFDLASLQKSGGHIYLTPLYYQSSMPHSTPGVGTDIWKIDGVSVAINLKPSAANPNPKPMGGNSLTWQLQGPNEIQLNSSNQTHGLFYFDRNFNPSGNQ
jgi:hypothetical protein